MVDSYHGRYACPPDCEDCSKADRAYDEFEQKYENDELTKKQKVYAQSLLHWRWEKAHEKYWSK